MTTPAPLRLFNSLTRQIEDFVPVHPGVAGDASQPPEARVYTCGPTVYNYPHIGNMRAYVFADTLGRVLAFKGYKLRHIINITDVGHLTDDADAGEDKMEKMAAERAQSIWDIAEHYTDAFKADHAALNCKPPEQWSVATKYVPAMIAFAESIADKHCYRLDSGLYFDTSTVADYGRLARAVTEDGEGRIEAVDGKRHAADFAIWRTTPAGESRQMEWDSPWGKGAPGWHLECSVMSRELLGLPFDIHTGGIDHREIHHPNEIAQNQAITGCGGLDCAEHSGARIWMHNNFLVERSGKMSKSSGEFLRLQLLIDKGFHPLAYRMLCLQAHYRSELEFSWEGLAAAFVRLKRLVRLAHDARSQIVTHIDFLFKQGADATEVERSAIPSLKEIIHPDILELIGDFEGSISNDLNTSESLIALERLVPLRHVDPAQKTAAMFAMFKVLGLDGIELLSHFVTPSSLRIRPKSATITEAEIEATLATRKQARAAKDFARSDALRDQLIAQGVEVMDGDPLGWDWRLDI